MKVAIYAWAGCGNFGDDWILEAFVSQASKRGHEVLLVREPQAVFEDNLSKYPSISWPGFYSSFRDSKKFESELNRYDALILAGGGWLASDRNSKEMIHWYVRFLNIKIPIYPVFLGVGPFNYKLGKSFAKSLFRKFKTDDFSPSVRTIEDGVYLAQLGIQHFEVATDLALIDEEFSFAPPSSNRSGIVVVLPSPASHRPREDIESWGNSLLSFCKSLGEEIYFVDFQFGLCSDHRYWSKLFENKLEAKNIHQAGDILSDSKYLVAGRLHSALLGIKTGVPNILAIGYHHKFDLLKNFGINPIHNDSTSFEFNQPSFDLAPNWHLVAEREFVRIWDSLESS